MGALDGKVAVVTGAARGVGRAEALLLAQEGATVVVNDVGGGWDGTGRDERPAQLVVDEITAAGGQASANYDDIGSWQGAEALIRQAIEGHGQLDVLINNAGILRDKMMFNMTEEDWDAVLRVHLKGHAATTHHACAYWRDQAKGGRQLSGAVVNTASESGLFGIRGQGNYGAAKAGIANLTRVTAIEMAKYGIRANGICPRARTRLITETFGDSMMAAPEDPNAFDAWAPENIAPLVAFLASDKASHISGQVFVVAGGLVQLAKPWEPGPQIDKGARWTVDELAGEIDKLFEGIPSTIHSIT